MASITSPDFPLKPMYMQSLAGEDPINYAAYEFRHQTDATWPTPGVIGRTDFAVSQADALGWNIRVGGGSATSGGYFIYLGSGITISVAGLNTNPSATRTHKVFLVVQDKANSGATSGYSANIIVSEDLGTGAPTPAATVSILLGTVKISPGQSNILNTHISANPRPASDLDLPYNLDTNNRLVSTVTSGDSTLNAAPARIRYGNGKVSFSGCLKLKSGAAFTLAAYDLGRLPDWAWPNTDRRLLGACSSAAMVWRMYISSADGMFSANIPADNNPSYLYLDGISYEIE